MTQRLLSETMISFSQAARRIPSGSRDGSVNAATVWRWSRRDLRLTDGTVVRLEAVKVGACWVTSVQALERFVAAQNPTPAEPAPVTTKPTKAKPSSRAERAAEKLKAMGA